MTRVNTRARVAIGSAVLAVAGLGVGLAGPLAVSASAPPSEPASSAPPTSEPVSSEPASSEPTGSAPELDADREQIVDAIVTMSEAENIPFDRDCVSGLVAQLPDADVPLVLVDIQESSESPDDSAAVTATDTMTTDTMTTDTMTTDTMTTDTMTTDAMTTDSPQISDEAEQLGEELITCVAGDADPALVSEALEVITADEETADVDLACVQPVLTALEDESLQAIIDEGSVSAINDSMDNIGSMGSEPGASDPVTGTEVSITEDPNTFLLFLCFPEFMDMDMDAMTVDTATAEPATSDTATGDSASDS